MGRRISMLCKEAAFWWRLYRGMATYQHALQRSLFLVAAIQGWATSELDANRDFSL